MNKFDQANENDLNTPNGITAINEAIKLINQELRQNKDSQILSSLYNVLTEMLHIYGLDIKLEKMSSENRLIYEEWNNARIRKDFEVADKLRKLLVERNILI